jgi:hypothetical protein
MAISGNRKTLETLPNTQNQNIAKLFSGAMASNENTDNAGNVSDNDDIESVGSEGMIEVDPSILDDDDDTMDTTAPRPKNPEAMGSEQTGNTEANRKGGKKRPTTPLIPPPPPPPPANRALVPDPTPGPSGVPPKGPTKPKVTTAGKTTLSEAAKRIVDGFAAQVTLPPTPGGAKAAAAADNNANPKIRLQLSDYLKGKSFAKAARPPLLTVYQTNYAQHPVSMANYLALRNFITTHQSAAILGADEEGNEMPDLAFEILPLDKETRGMPIQPENRFSQEWLEEMINDLIIGETSFKSWLPGEKPQNFAMEIYLHSDHDGLTSEQVLKLLKHLNRHPPLPVDFKLLDIKQQTDKQGTPMGRVVNVAAGPNFYGYCKAHGFKLKFSGGNVPCITMEDKARSLQVKKRPNPPNPPNDGHKKSREPKDSNKKPKGGK